MPRRQSREIAEPTLISYFWDTRPKFVGPTKAQLTARQFNPLSEFPLSPDSQFRNWKADQERKERRHNARIKDLLAEREESEEHEEGEAIGEEGGFGEGSRFEDPRRRHPTSNAERRGGSVRSEHHGESIGNIHDASPRRYNPRESHRQKRSGVEGDDEDGHSLQRSPRRDTKRRKRNEDREEKL
ncbi:hypothetical protein WAI453_003353 [Rhynchosporium graminicola]|uniref:Uncharacterized protein n=1 Tax=Rhynchosporium graminicola TaxID=2792576 RepID=A0A1E1KPY8_9HELO|nr:uncharacterized protein RCO7_01785 [Rhynchosporium commune]